MGVFWATFVVSNDQGTTTDTTGFPPDSLIWLVTSNLGAPGTVLWVVPAATRKRGKGATPRHDATWNSAPDESMASGQLVVDSVVEWVSLRYDALTRKAWKSAVLMLFLTAALRVLLSCCLHCFFPWLILYTSDISMLCWGAQAGIGLRSCSTTPENRELTHGPNRRS